MPRLIVEQLHHAFDGIAVLQGVSLSVEPGQILCLVGPSGCGKTTLLRLIAGLEPVGSGSVAIDGRIVANPAVHVPPERRDVGMVFQDYALFPHLSIADNVGFGLAGRSRADRRAIAVAALADVGLADRADELPHALSGGQQQRVAVARALAARPRLVLLDEPFSSLDVRLRGRLRTETRRLLKDSGAGTVLVTHDPEEAMFMADRIALVEKGRILQVGTPEALYRQPQNAFVAEFFGEVNRIDGCVAGGGVTTALGTFPAGGLAEGRRVEVLIRPEALIAAVPGETDVIAARVMDARIIGSLSILELEIDAGNPVPLRLQSRLPSDIPAPAGSSISLRLDRRKVHIFTRPDGDA
jgi:iron(III) transport system ATP-binding protein